MCNRNMCGAAVASQIGCRSGNTLAIINFPIQYADWNNLYTQEKGLDVGTIFPCLNKPLGRERTGVSR